jgi:hypothetical protein
MDWQAVSKDPAGELGVEQTMLALSSVKHAHCGKIQWNDVNQGLSGFGKMRLQSVDMRALCQQSYWSVPTETEVKISLDRETGPCLAWKTFL